MRFARVKALPIYINKRHILATLTHRVVLTIKEENSSKRYNSEAGQSNQLRNVC